MRRQPTKQTTRRAGGRAWFTMPAGWHAGPVDDGLPCPICGTIMFRAECGCVCGAPGEMHGKIHDPNGRPER